MLVTMAPEISATEHLGKLRNNVYLYEKVDYLLNLYETVGVRKMLEVLDYYNDFESDGLVLLVALARRIVLHEGENEALKTLAKFEEGLVKNMVDPLRPTFVKATAEENLARQSRVVIVEEA